MEWGYDPCLPRVTALPQMMSFFKPYQSPRWRYCDVVTKQNKTQQWAGGDRLCHGNMDNWSVSWLRGNNKESLVTIGQAIWQGSTLSPWQHVPVGHVVSKFYVPWQNFYLPDKITNYFPSHNFALTIKWTIFGEMSKHHRSVVSTTFSLSWVWIHNKCFVLLNSTEMSNVLH